MIYLTLNQIREHSPCADGWEKLLKHLEKTKADDEPVSLLNVLDSNGLDDTLWCFRALDEKYENWVRLTVCELVQPAMKYTDDPRPQKALDVARAYAKGEATDKELDAARGAAWDAARDAARDAAAAAASAAARGAAWGAARGAATAAARGATAASAAARDAAAAAAAAWAEQEQILRSAIEQHGEVERDDED